jgi:hypothetical protein
VEKMAQQWKRVSIGYAGRAYAGVYSVVGEVVNVASTYGRSVGAIGCASANPQSVAQVLLRGIVHASAIRAATFPDAPGRLKPS